MASQNLIDMIILIQVMAYNWDKLNQHLIYDMDK